MPRQDKQGAEGSDLAKDKWPVKKLPASSPRLGEQVFLGTYLFIAWIGGGGAQESLAQA